MELDLSPIYSLVSFPVKTPQKIHVEVPSWVQEPTKHTIEPQKPSERLTDGLEREQAKRLFEREKDDHRKSLEVYQTYQENTKISELLRAEILKGTKAGKDIYGLFLKAVEAISLMTHDSHFYSQIKEDVRVIYGRGLQEKPVLQMEIQETEKRLQKFREAEKREEPREDRERIKKAIQLNEEELLRLTELIGNPAAETQ